MLNINIKFLQFVFILAILIPACSCSSKPKLYPNDHLMTVSKEQSDRDIQECMSLADSYADDQEKIRGAIENTTKASIAGTAAGAVGGAIVHNAGRGPAIGAASAAVIAIFNELYSLGEKDPTYQRFAEFCLAKRGYQVAGWR